MDAPPARPLPPGEGKSGLQYITFRPPEAKAAYSTALFGPRRQKLPTVLHFSAPRGKSGLLYYTFRPPGGKRSLQYSTFRPPEVKAAYSTTLFGPRRQK